MQYYDVLGLLCLICMLAISLLGGDHCSFCYWFSSLSDVIRSFSCLLRLQGLESAVSFLPTQHRQVTATHNK